jgi:hypothetical protein
MQYTKVAGYRILISYYFAIDDVWQNSEFTPHWNYKIYSEERIALGAIKDMIDSGKYLKEEKFKIETLYLIK